MKTPGVYVVEKNAFPNSIVEVETAVPAFIGYTQKADYRGSSLINKPKEISSLNESQHAMNTLDQMRATAVDQSPAVLRVTSAGTPYSFSQTNGWQLLYYGMRMFFANGGGKCFIVSVGNYGDEISKDVLINGVTPLVKEQLPTMVIVPDAMQLSSIDECKDVQTAMLAHCGKMANRVAILDVWQGWKDGDEVVQNFRESIGNNSLKYGTAYYPWLESSVVSDRYLGLEHIENKEVLVKALRAELDTQDTKRQKENEALFADIESVTHNALELQDLDEASREALDTLNDTVRAQSQVYKNIISELKDKLNLLPPSAAMAGIYTRVDNQRGVWKAPANVSVSMVNRPSVSISHDEQESLNVDLKGKSINAIREFVGEGVMVWGARTLDGNSLDWRYINVQRTLIMLEQSTRLAAKAFVFEPNTANTWVTMKSMISNFLTGIWKRGGLAGASPEDAFSVHVGLGETMTPEDILEGIMRITVLVAPSRPAEFIEITFQQQAQKT